ncbi:polysaccharide deacetylase family protein [Antarcticibacterium flavum]|uniref:Polysaccharide deacetylase family protein n=1 Tax=Antarcticibacterium flavum TaxID=2058175 RepID=A0A5B7X082_9FLAO|nr:MULTISPECIES: polysaccharide deacetylase family protein [Antarcticibacterium]MCM4158828.1 polysaccharide deacetylase family protein [Antarcticibacterium sp. W02-3]QCY68092.1 polysaccharide deacetylase family protein [Antarcticibacterium flavum]
MKFETLHRIVLGVLLIAALLSAFHFIPGLLVIGLVLGYMGFLLFVSTNVQLNFFLRAFNNNPEETERRIALTFDDGPVENTLKILEVLEKYKVEASFFCIGKNVKENPEIFNLIIKKGHFVGNHTYSHTRKMGFLSTNAMLQEIKKCDKIFKKVGGITPGTFRPPFGIINPQVRGALEISGHKVIGWNLRSYDAVINSEELVVKRVLENVKPGDVILFHDNKENTVEILEQLLLFLRANHFDPVRVDELFNIDAYT